MLDEKTVREAICTFGHRLWLRGMVAANDGNISVRLPDGSVLCTPAGVSKGFMEPDALSKLSADGELLSGARQTSEVGMHLEVYRLRTGINAVVHAHPAAATGWAIGGREFPVGILAEAVAAFGHVPVAEYATPGTARVADVVRPHLGTANAVLLMNHGAMTLGEDLEQAYYRMEVLEHVAQTALAAVQAAAGAPLQEVPEAGLNEISDHG
ncbi:MAG TPA: class II aldolase family protein [Armatimonadetes bacterium]|jgi:L-fuculose-phosphate aldolase|nr:class II aldolase family protein [Armatimonadota bacterium]